MAELAHDASGPASSEPVGTAQQASGPASSERVPQTKAHPARPLHLRGDVRA
jgi:hypothetical protein